MKAFRKLNRTVLATTGGAAIVVAGAVACSGTRSVATLGSSSARGPSNVTAPRPFPTLAPGQAKVSIDGQDQDVSGGVVICRPTAGGTAISIMTKSETGYVVDLTDGDPLQVNRVEIINAPGQAAGQSSTVLGYDPDSHQGSAEGTKQGSNSYQVTGTASGLLLDRNLLQSKLVHRAFEIDVVCR